MLVALVGSTLAYDKGKLVERHVFRLMSPDDGDIGDNDERYKLQFNGNALVSITQRGSFDSQKVQKQTYLNWFDNTARFIMQNPGKHRTRLHNHYPRIFFKDKGIRRY